MARPGCFDFPVMEAYFENHSSVHSITMTFDEMRAYFGGLSPAYLTYKHLDDHYDYAFQKHLHSKEWHVESVDYNTKRIVFLHQQ